MPKQKKEATQIMIIKTLLTILLFAGMGIIIIGGGCIMSEYYQNEAKNRITKPVQKPVNQKTENYYDLLEKKCAGDSCCLASLKVMRSGNYKGADENGNCSDGFNRNMMKCITSYQWCVPMEEETDTSDWQTYQNEEFGFEIKYPEYYCELRYDFGSMAEEDYDRIHLFRYMSEEELNDFKKHYITTLEEGGTHSGTVLIKLYNNEKELKKWYGIESFKDIEFKEFENIDYYIVNKLTKNSSHTNEELIIGYNYIVPHREINDLFLVFEIPEFLKLKFEKDFLSSFKFIEN